MLLNAPPTEPHAHERRTSGYEGTTVYDAGIIERFADQLYARAAAVVFLYTFVGLLIGAAAGFATKQYFQNSIAGWIAGGVVVAAAIYLGQQRAFQLRLQAQMALCQVQIERNTRNSAAR